VDVLRAARRFCHGQLQDEVARLAAALPVSTSATVRDLRETLSIR